MRARLFRALHAEAAKRGLDHDGLRDICCERFSARSMGQLSAEQLQAVYRAWTGHRFRERRQTALPKRGYARAGGPVEMVSAEDIETLGRAFARLGWADRQRETFIRRQIGRLEIRTRTDFWRIFSGLRAILRRTSVQAGPCPPRG